MSMSELESGSATVGGGEGGCHHTDLIRSCCSCVFLFLRESVSSVELESGATRLFSKQ